MVAATFRSASSGTGPPPKPSKFTGLANLRDGEQLRYPHDLVSGADAPEAVALLRRTLAAAEDGSVVIVQVGFLDEFGAAVGVGTGRDLPLSGVELVRKKVRFLSIMAGSFAATGDSPQPSTT